MNLHHSVLSVLLVCKGVKRKKWASWKCVLGKRLVPNTTCYVRNKKMAIRHLNFSRKQLTEGADLRKIFVLASCPQLFMTTQHGFFSIKAQKPIAKLEGWATVATNHQFQPVDFTDLPIHIHVVSKKFRGKFCNTPTEGSTRLPAQSHSTHSTNLYTSMLQETSSFLRVQMLLFWPRGCHVCDFIINTSTADQKKEQMWISIWNWTNLPQRQA